MGKHGAARKHHLAHIPARSHFHGQRATLPEPPAHLGTLALGPSLRAVFRHPGRVDNEHRSPVSAGAGNFRRLSVVEHHATLARPLADAFPKKARGRSVGLREAWVDGFKRLKAQRQVTEKDPFFDRKTGLVSGARVPRSGARIVQNHRPTPLSSPEATPFAPFWEKHQLVFGKH